MSKIEIPSVRFFGGFAVLALAFWAESSGAPIPPPDPSRFRLVGTVTPVATFYQGLPWLAQVSIHAPVLLPEQPEEEKLPAETREALFLARWRDGYLPIFDVVAPSSFRFRVKLSSDDKKMQDSGVPGLGSFYLRSPDEFERPVGRPVMRMFATGHADFLVDLRPHFQKLDSGNYSLSTQLYGDTNRENPRWSAKAVPIQVRPLPDDAKIVLKKAMPTFEAERKSVGFTDWVTEDVDLNLLQAKLPREVFSVLALHCFLNSTRKAGRADKARLEFLEKIPVQLKALADCLRYEVLLSRKQEKAATQLKEQILRNHPALKWRINAADEGWGT